jgi:hypothetical protein
MSDVCRALGIRPSGGNYETLWRWTESLRIDGEHLRISRTSREDLELLATMLDPNRVAEAVAASSSFAGACRYLGLDETRHRRRLMRAVEAFGLDVSHFSGQGWRKGSRTPVIRARPLAEILCAGRISNSSDVRRRLLAEGLKEHRCEGCGLREWAGRPIPLELDHVNGDRTDNRLENLRLLCPNCHALTPTYRGRNIGRRGAMVTRPS